MQDRFYQPAVLWDYFREWFEKSPSATDGKPSLLVFRLTQAGAYFLEDDNLKWWEQPTEGEPVECNQNELWVNQDDLGIVEVYIQEQNNEPVHNWSSFREFIESLQQ